MRAPRANVHGVDNLSEIAPRSWYGALRPDAADLEGGNRQRIYRSSRGAGEAQCRGVPSRLSWKALILSMRSTESGVNQPFTIGLNGSLKI